MSRFGAIFEVCVGREMCSERSSLPESKKRCDFSSPLNREHFYDNHLQLLQIYKIQLLQSNHKFSCFSFDSVVAMSQKPMSYLCSKCVLSHFEANTRIALVARCPTLRSVHKNAPLKIDELVLNENSLVLNGIMHFFHTMIYSETDQDLPYIFQKAYADRGVNYDVNEYGRRDRNKYLENGDLEILGNPLEHHPNDFFLQQREENDERARRGLKEIRFIRDDDESDLEDNNDLVRIQRPVYKSLIYCTFYHLSTPTCTSRFIFPRGQKIRNVIRSHLFNILSVKQPVFLKNMTAEMVQGVLRLPQQLKLVAQNLTLSSHVLKSIESIVYPEGERCVQLDALPQVILFKDLNLVRSVFEETQRRLYPFPVYQPIQTLIKLSTNSIHLRDVTDDDLIGLIENWIENPRKIGTRLTVPSSNLITIMNFISQKLDLDIEENLLNPVCSQYISKNLGSNKELRIYGDDIAAHRGESTEFYRKPFLLIVKIFSNAN